MFISCKLNKAQQAVEDKVMSSLTPLQQFKLQSQTAALIYAIQRGELPLPNIEKLMAWEEAQRTGIPPTLIKRNGSTASGTSLASPTPGSPITDADVTPKADFANKPVAQGTVWNEALLKIAETDGKLSKKTSKKTSKKKGLSTEVADREFAAPETALKKMTSTTTIVKKTLPEPIPVSAKKLTKSTSSAVLNKAEQLVVASPGLLKKAESVASSIGSSVMKSKKMGLVDSTPSKQIVAMTASVTASASKQVIKVTKATKSGQGAQVITIEKVQTVEKRPMEAPVNQNLEVEEVHDEEEASPPKQRRSKSSPPTARLTREKTLPVPPVAEPEFSDEEYFESPEKAQSPVKEPVRRSKRSLTVDPKLSLREVDADVASPQVRRSRLTEKVDAPKQILSSPEQENRKGSLRSSKNAAIAVIEKAPEPDQEPEPEEEPEEPELEHDLDEVVSDDEDAADADFENELVAEDILEEGEVEELTPEPPKRVSKKKSAPKIDVEIPAAPENKSTRTRPVNKKKSDQIQAGPEFDQQLQTTGATRTKTKNKANRPESRNAGPEDAEAAAPVIIPTASALYEAEKMMQNYHAKNDPKKAPKTSTAAAQPVSKPHYGNAPPSAQKPTGLPRLGTPMKDTAKKPGQPAPQPTTASKVYRLENMTPQQKGAFNNPAVGLTEVKVPAPTVHVPFGSGGAPSKPKLQPQTGTKPPSRPNSPGGALNKVPIAMGLAGAVALGKIQVPIAEVPSNEQPQKYSNLVSNVMSFMPQNHNLASSSTTSKTKLGNSVSASALKQAASAQAKGKETKTGGLAGASAASTASSTKLPQAGKGLSSAGPSSSKLPTPVNGPTSASKPAHQAVQMGTKLANAFTSHTSNQLPIITIEQAKQQAPNKHIQQLQQHAHFDEENLAHNSTYTKGANAGTSFLDSTMAAFDITKWEESYVDYPIDDIKPCGDDDDDEEEDTKPIPDWAKPERLKARIAKQNANPQLDTKIRKRLDMDEEKVSIDGIEQALQNPDRPARIRPRTSSQHWTTPPLLKSKQQKAQQQQ